MEEIKSTSIRCQHCQKWFPSPIQYHDVKTFLRATQGSSTAQCPHCSERTACNRENTRITTIDDRVISGTDAE